MSRSMVMHELERNRRKNGLPIPEKFEHAVQSTYNHYSVDSMVYAERGSPPVDGIFFSPQGKGSGKWAVKRDRVQAWKNAHTYKQDGSK